ncbi:hypothetical protein N9L94_01600 [Robiginitalea sp.]|nr:hypothetical protein [Robiginitalea sp.]
MLKTPFYTLIALLSVGLLSLGCKGETPPSESNKMAEVIAVHDEVMPKMSEIGKLVAQLKPMADSSETGLPYLKAMRDLQDAHAAMMDWMKGFGDRFDYEEVMEGKPLSPEKIALLKDEEVKVKAMRDLVLQSINSAEKILDEAQ